MLALDSLSWLLGTTWVLTLYSLTWLLSTTWVLTLDSLSWLLGGTWVLTLYSLTWVLSTTWVLRLDSLSWLLGNTWVLTLDSLTWLLGAGYHTSVGCHLGSGITGSLIAVPSLINDIGPAHFTYNYVYIFSASHIYSGNNGNWYFPAFV